MVGDNMCSKDLPPMLECPTKGDYIYRLTFPKNIMQVFPKVPENQKETFNSYYVAKKGIKLHAEGRYFYDLVRKPIHKVGGGVMIEDIINPLRERTAKRFMEALSGDLSVTADTWDCLTSICHVWNMAEKKEQYELCAVMKIMIDAVMTTNEYVEFYKHLHSIAGDKVPRLSGYGVTLALK